MAELITIAKYTPPHWRPKGLDFNISKLHRVDDHLFSFMVWHDYVKYPHIDIVSGYDPSTKRNYYVVQIVDSGDRDYYELTEEDYNGGRVKGGAVKILYKPPIVDFLFHWEPLKWEEQFFMMVDYESRDLWTIEGGKYDLSPSIP